MRETLQTNLLNPVTALEHEIASLGPWFHNLHLPDGTQTAPEHPLGDFPTFKWRELQDLVPANLTGWSVLDIGCNSGYYSFEFAKRGAAVTAIDLNPHYLKQAKWAAVHLGLEGQVTFKQMPLYDLAGMDEEYDLIWFMGVLYHLRYPMLALDIICRKARRQLVIQSLTTNDTTVVTDTHDLGFDDIERMSAPGWPAMAYVEHELLGDPTNWWLPNEAGMEAMLRSAGMKVEHHPAPGTYVCVPINEGFNYQEELDSALGRKKSQ